MYRVGDLILYGKTGICRVEGFEEKSLSHGEAPSLYYILCPLYQSGQIYAPTDRVSDGTIFTRPIMNREEAVAFIRSLPTLDAQPYYNQNLTQLKDHYRRQLQTPSCQDLALLMRSIYVKRQEVREKNRKLTMVDQAFLDEAQALLYGELAAALGIAREEVPGYIESTLNGAL